MACTYKLIWERYEEVRKSYMDLVFNAEKHGCTVAQYDHGGVLLADMQIELMDMLAESDDLTEVTKKETQSAIITLLNAVNSALCDARLFTADPAQFINASNR